MVTSFFLVTYLFPGLAFPQGLWLCTCPSMTFPGLLQEAHAGAPFPRRLQPHQHGPGLIPHTPIVVGFWSLGYAPLLLPSHCFPPTSTATGIYAVDPSPGGW